MDEVKIKSTFAQMMLSKFINKAIEKKFGPGIEVFVNGLSIEKDSEREAYYLKADIDGYVSNKVVEDLICKKRSGSGTS